MHSEDMRGPVLAFNFSAGVGQGLTYVVFHGLIQV